MKKACTSILTSLVAVSIAATCWGSGTRTEGPGPGNSEPRVRMENGVTDTEGATEPGKTTGEERGDGERPKEERKPDIGGPPTTEPHYGTPPLGGPDGGILEAIPERDGTGTGENGR